MSTYLTDLIEWRGRRQKGILRFAQVRRTRGQAVHILQCRLPDVRCVLVKEKGTQNLARTREIEEIVWRDFRKDLGRLSVFVGNDNVYVCELSPRPGYPPEAQAVAQGFHASGERDGQ